ncbi:3-oxoacyl-[acyl-carrier-protein] synthase-3 [Krasilnikovia cinnamomea]|uniref:3-oxoacyl-[acyl-carrier-protein] synthase-3 n=1 Tax=Krasilnikovia cinnamomea TaxID=349313 RepID=A0A4Q7ZSP3_9ACTN|nr:3-oxoacyl-[acyl-carrier-protein] synthase III C-terminal domain-containing protein [Krasilnikovia cinnamomea]RZU54218.1 3-oxoacyl-[acyl-carrier-protein] synthase-3 [Krasilnikovia cinnamomea]
MPTAITSTAVSTDPHLSGSIARASAAATACLNRAGVHPDQVDVLINVGVYRDENMAEPAMSALIQKNVGTNLDYLRSGSPAFSFDLMNGACGLLNAVQVAGAFLAGDAEYALVVSGDTHPSGRPDPDFGYAHVGAAMLLSRSADAGTGFGPVSTVTAPDDAPGVRGYADLGAVGTHGREMIWVRRDPDYARRLVELAAAEASRYAAEQGLDLSRTLLVASQPTPSFAAELAQRLGVPADAVVTVHGVDGDPHTSALTLAYHQAVEAGQADAYPEALFVAAGAGLSVACSVYHRAG